MSSNVKIFKPDSKLKSKTLFSFIKKDKFNSLHRIVLLIILLIIKRLKIFSSILCVK